MSGFSSSAIILRRMDFSDHDVIIDFFTQNRGRVTAVAKNAKKSKKRFAGVLELFSCVDAVFLYPKKADGLLLLKEAFLTQPFAGIRTDVEKFAYASYWAEMVNRSSEAAVRQEGVFTLLHYVLTALEGGALSAEKLSILFQMRFLSLIGLAPEISVCRVCRQPVAGLAQDRFVFDVAGGGVVCRNCRPMLEAELENMPAGGGAGTRSRAVLSKGTLKRLQWLRESDLASSGRVQFDRASQKEALLVMEWFVLYHLSSAIKSLAILRRMRRETSGGYYE